MLGNVPKMTTKAARAWKVYRDLGPQRTLKEAAELLGYSRRSNSTLAKWSAKYGWPRLAAEHDHATLRESLGRREIVREQTLQSMVDRMQETSDLLWGIITDAERLPVLDRHGEPLKDKDGNPITKPTVKASTRLEAMKTLLGITGLVPVKRLEHVDKTAEGLDAAANVIRTLTPAQLEQLSGILDSDEPT